MLILTLVISFIAGLALGLFYFGGLWATLRYLPRYKRPILMTMASFLVRTAIALFGFYLIVVGDHLDRLIAALAGFVIMRIVLVRFQVKKRERIIEKPGGKED